MDALNAEQKYTYEPSTYQPDFDNLSKTGDRTAVYIAGDGEEDVEAQKRDNALAVGIVAGLPLAIWGIIQWVGTHP